MVGALVRAVGDDADQSFADLRRANRPQLVRLLSADPAAAAPWVRVAAERGVVEAQVRLGRMLLAGQGVAVDETAALGWFRTAARRSDADAMNMIGRCCENGWGTAADYAEAVRWYRRAAEAGDLWAQYNLGHCLLDGMGVFPDRRQAVHWYRRAARGGHARAMNLLGRCLEEGWGTPCDRGAASFWYARSAGSGYFRGQYNHATMLVAAGDTAAAAVWFECAAANGTDAVRRIVIHTLETASAPILRSSGAKLRARYGGPTSPDG